MALVLFSPGADAAPELDTLKAAMNLDVDERDKDAENIRTLAQVAKDTLESIKRLEKIVTRHRPRPTDPEGHE